MQRKWIYPLGFLVLVFIVFYLFKKYRIAPDLTIQQLQLVDLKNNKVDTLTKQGQKTLVCFGASWCGPCRQELKIISELKDSDLKDVRVVFISDENLEHIDSFYQQTGYDFEWLKLRQPFKDIGINSIPTSYLLNTKGKIVEKKVGFIDWRDPSTARHLLKLME